MIRWLGISFLILFISIRVLAIDAIVSHALFFVPDPAQSNKLMPSVEAYWQVNPRTVRYTTTPEKTIIAHIKTDITFSNETGIIKEEHFILQTVPCTTIKELMMHSIIDMRRCSVTQGQVKIKLVLTDLADSLHPFTFLDSFAASPPDNTPFYSDLQLLDTIIESPAHTVFLKNGHQQVPECTNFLDENKSILHYYAELYQADKIARSDYPLIQRISITKKENENPFAQFLKTDTVAAQQLSVISGSFPISTLASGNYFLTITLENSYRLKLASATLFFQRLNTHPAKEKEDTGSKKKAAVIDTGIENINVLNLGKTFLAQYNTPQITSILKMLLPVVDPLGTQTINGFLKKPEDLYMRYFIYNYFLAINKKKPGDAWEEYSNKVREVNKRFKASGTPGYATERGFIFLRYGEPTEIITVENENGSLPYEIWQYNTLTQMNRKDIANALFLFYKPNEMLGDYKLLHSNVSGEAQNTAWRSYLYLKGSNADSRAEQYMENK